jgi:hypothetical protein
MAGLGIDQPDRVGLRLELIQYRSHQLGSFLGAFGGGLLFDALGSYALAWRLAVGMGLAAGVVQVSFALLRPTRLATGCHEVSNPLHRRYAPSRRDRFIGRAQGIRQSPCPAGSMIPSARI